MSEQFLDGVEVINIDNGSRPVQTIRSFVLGLIGTAPNADVTQFPSNTPVLVFSRTEAAGLGADGTLLDTIERKFDEYDTAVIIVRVDEGADDAETLTNVIGGVESDGSRTGLQAFLDAKSVLGYQPRILVAPEFSHQAACMTELAALATRLRAVAIIDGPNTTDADAIAQAGTSGSQRLFMVDPWVKVFKNSAETIEPASARVAGMLAWSDHNRGFWWSPSNLEMFGIIGTARPVDFSLGDVNARANLLNEKNITTIIQESGYRLWGNRTLSSDPKWSFINVMRTADMINDSILRSHLWAVDRNITKTYLQDLKESVNNYLRQLTSIGAILGGSCWLDPELNTPDQIAAGRVYVNFDFTPPAPAERITFRSEVVNDYIQEIIA
ncbi:MAG: phage tail sheath C-terminal domain-containing protein [Pseudomonadota bacterium]